VSNIAIEGVHRFFGSVAAVRNITLDIKDGEFFTLLGPSGCGKTTLLRMIAGFTPLDSGTISTGRTRIDNLPPHKRNIGMVFQNYAIFPNLSVAGNVAYGLKARKVAPDEITSRVADALALVQLKGYGERWPHQLSGGQLQRVAIARALVIRPEVLLLDEPLSNLDARLRVDMRAEIRDLQQRLKITTVYVTHDQEEALAVSHRIAVMQSGSVEQLDAPIEIYRNPSNLFVAQFMGTTNVLMGTTVRDAGGRTAVKVGETLIAVATIAGADGHAVTLSLRPEALRILGDGQSPAPNEVSFTATVVKTEFTGPISRLDIVLAGGIPLKVAVLDSPAASLAPGTTIALAYHPERVNVLEGGRA
jgi:ABC-type Fe3+/spermidine/putrescine transport system ATPase subunit